MGKAVTAARQPDATQPGTDAIYRNRFDSFSYHLAQAGIADLRHHAQRAVLARVAHRARPGPRGRATPLLPALRRLAQRKPSPRTGWQVPVSGPGETTPALTPRELDVLRLVAQGLEHPEFGGDSILPRSCCLGWGPVPTIRPAGRTAGLVISQFPSLVLSNICPAALS